VFYWLSQSGKNQFLGQNTCLCNKRALIRVDILFDNQAVSFLGILNFNLLLHSQFVRHGSGPVFKFIYDKAYVSPMVNT